jgi:hypothetical protein
MPEAAPRPTLLRRLAVVGSFGLFALAVVQAQHGCGDGSVHAPATAPEARVDPEPAELAPATPEAEPVDRPDPGSGTKAAAGEEEIPMFLGASKSGRVMEPPRPRAQEPVQQAQVPNPPPQQNARPGT